MTKKILLPLLVLLSFGLRAETIKTDVLVVGGSPSGVAAAMQCARSNVKAMLIEQGSWLGGSMTAGGMCILDANRDLPSGIWGEFKKHITDYYRPRLGYDTSRFAVLRFEPSVGASILKKMTDTVKNLTIKMKTPWTSIKKDGEGWEVTITENGQTTTIRAKVVIDATETGDIAEKAGAKFNIGFDSRAETKEPIAPEQAAPQIEDLTWIAILKDYGKGTNATIAKPEGYDPSLYACLKGKDIKKLLADGALIDDKYMIKWGECGNEYAVTAEGMSPAHREELYKKARLHTLGMVYYLETELGYKNLGLSDEFGTPDKLPSQPYLREYRRAKGMVNMTVNQIYEPYADKLYRTSIGVGNASPGNHYSDPAAPKLTYAPMPPYSIPLGAVLAQGQENLLVTGCAMAASHLANASTFYPSVQMTVGQGAGCIAAYCAFFKTTTAHLSVRKIQVELLDHRGYLLPITDITRTDRSFRAVQQVCATGLLKTVTAKQGNRLVMNFEPDTIVNTAEVKPVLTEIYTRAFLWFNREKPGEKFTVGNMLSFISEITLSDPEAFRLTTQKEWQTIYKFKSEFDPEHPITRREFAVLANKYLNPFARRVDLEGRMVN